MELFETLSLKTIVQMCIAAICGYLHILFFTRVTDKRTFAQMTNFAFAVTITMKSILADVANKPISNIVPAFVSLALLAGLQVLFSKLLSASNKAQKVLTNTPIGLMKNGVIFDDKLIKALMSRADLIGKLREANVLSLSQVKAVVFETMGDVSVLYSTNNITIDPIIMEDISTSLTI